MNKQDIINKSVSIINKEGLGALTTSRLSKELNVKPPSLYKHIRNMNDLHDDLGILCVQNLITLIQKNVFGHSGDDALRILAHSFRDFGRKNPGLYESMQLTHMKRSKAYQNVALRLLDLLKRVLTPYKIQEENRIHAIRNFRCILHGFIDLEIQKGFGLPQELDESFEMAIDGFIFNLKKIY